MAAISFQIRVGVAKASAGDTGIKIRVSQKIAFYIAKFVVLYNNSGRKKAESLMNIKHHLHNTERIDVINLLSEITKHELLLPWLTNQ